MFVANSMKCSTNDHQSIITASSPIFLILIQLSLTLHALFVVTSVSVFLIISTIIQFSLVRSLDRVGRRGGREGRFSKDSLPVVLEEGHREQFWHEQGQQLVRVVHSAFPLPTTVSPALQGAFLAAVVFIIQASQHS